MVFSCIYKFSGFDLIYYILRGPWYSAVSICFLVSISFITFFAVHGIQLYLFVFWFRSHSLHSSRSVLHDCLFIIESLQTKIKTTNQFQTKYVLSRFKVHIYIYISSPFVYHVNCFIARIFHYFNDIFHYFSL